MNYYIQGDAANAERIKAAFEKLGYDVTGFDMCNDNILFFTYKLQTGANVISTANANLYTASIIKTHPDYKELELPVEPKFKVGDWVVCWNRTYQILDNKSTYNVREINGLETRYEHSTVYENGHLWTIADAKDGDVLVDEYTDTIGIFEETNGIYWNSKIYCAKSISTKVYHRGGSHHIKFVKPATKEQRDLLFAKMKEAGYQWDADKKELKKIKSHYDISNFKPFDKVLVRCSNDEEWMIEFYCKYDTLVHTSPHRDYPFMGIGDSYAQCIPFEGNEHLLGTTDMCDKQYINW